jgi:hypothetical protein
VLTGGVIACTPLLNSGRRSRRVRRGDPTGSTPAAIAPQRAAASGDQFDPFQHIWAAWLVTFPWIRNLCAISLVCQQRRSHFFGVRAAGVKPIGMSPAGSHLRRPIHRSLDG